MVVMPLNSIVILSTIVVWFQGGINGKKKKFHLGLHSNCFGVEFRFRPTFNIIWVLVLLVFRLHF